MQPATLYFPRLVLALLALSLTGGRAYASPEEDVDRAEDARYDAMIRGDAAALASLLADEFLYHQPSGKTATKASYIQQTTSGVSRRPLAARCAPVGLQDAVIPTWKRDQHV